MKILHLQTELNLACGITRTISQIIKNSSKEFEHHLIALGGNGLSRFETINFNPKILNLNRFSLIGALKIYLFLLNYCKEHSIQIIHSHHRYFDTLVWFLKPVMKIKTITSVQSKVFGKKVFSYKADKLIACSKTIKNHLLNKYKIDDNRIEVIYNAVDSASINSDTKSEELKKELNIGFDDFVIGFIGRIDFKEKGVDILLDAFNALLKQYSKIHLLLIGEGSNFNQVEIYCGLNKSKATLLSSKENIFEYYNLMNLIVLPSRVDPFPLTMIETGLMKRTLIGSNVDGIAEFIAHGVNGLLFESGNSDGLKQQIVKIIENKKFGSTIADSLYNKVITSFTVQKIVPRYEKLYKDILNYAN